MTVYKPIQKLAAKAAEISMKAAKGEKVDGENVTLFNGTDNVPIIYVDIIKVDKSNIESTVIADGFQSKEEIMK